MMQQLRLKINKLYSSCFILRRCCFLNSLLMYLYVHCAAHYRKRLAAKRNLSSILTSKSVLLIILLLFSISYLFYSQITRPARAILKQQQQLIMIYQEELLWLKKLKPFGQSLAQKNTILVKRHNHSMLTIESLAHRLQAAQLTVLDIKPKLSQENSATFIISCSGAYHDLLLFINTLLESHYFIAIPVLQLEPEEYRMELTEVFE